mgnify:CR=1 FL=1
MVVLIFYHVEVVKIIKTVVESEIKMLTENTMLTSFIFDYLNNIYEEELDLNSICQNFWQVQKEIND